MHYPQIPNCETCEKFLVSSDTWTVTIWKTTGQPMPRRPDAPPPCQLCPKCDGEPQKNPQTGRQNEISAKNRQAIDRYWEHQACGAGAETDSVFRRNAGLIHRQIAAHERFQRQQMIRVSIFQAEKPKAS